MIYLFLGQEDFLKKEALDKLKSKVSGADSSGLNYEEFQAGEDDLDKIVDCARTAPFMAKFRLLAVKEANRFNTQEKEKLSLFMPNAPASVVLVLLADSLSPSDPLYKAALKNARVVSFDKLSGGRLHRWISERFSRLGKRIQADAIRALVDNIGNSLTRLNLAVELLATFIGQADTVIIDDVERLIGKDLDVTAYQLIDAIGSKDADRALRILDSLDKDNKTISRTIGLIGWHLRRIWRAKKLLNQRMPASRIAVTVGMPQYSKDSFFRQVDNFSARDLERGFKAMLKTDKDIKSTGSRPRRALELLVIQLCAGPH